MTIVACPTAAPCNARVQEPMRPLRRLAAFLALVLAAVKALSATSRGHEFLHLSLPTLSMLICAGVLGAIILDCGILECHQCWETESIMRLTR